MGSEIATLNRNTDFRRAYSRGKCYTHPAVILYVAKNRLGFCRIGITASKKTGNAVERNRSRRVIKAAVLSLSPCLEGSRDLVFVARNKTKYLKSNQLAEILAAQLIKAGVIKDEKLSS